MSVAGQHVAHEDRGWDEQRRSLQPQRVQCGSNEGGGDEEADTAAGGEVAHRGRAASRGEPGVAPGWGVEHGHPEPGAQQEGEYERIGGGEPGQPGDRSGDADPERCEPRQPVPVSEDAHGQLWQRAAKRRRQRKTRRGEVAVTAVEDEERHRRRDQPLVEVVDSVGTGPHPHS